MSCDQCQQFCERERVNNPYEYREVAKQLIDCVNRGVLAVVSGTCPLEAIANRTGTWPADTITHVFRCTRCNQQFTISVDTYHGSGGTWGPAQ